MKLNQSKSKGLWLGSWRGRQAPRVFLDWASSKIKVLGIFIVPGNLDEDNWRPRIDAVKNVLSFLVCRTLTYGGRVFVINALAPSRVWWVDSLIHMLGWAHFELSKLVSKFFWEGKPDLVARVVVSQPKGCWQFFGY